MIGNVHLGEFYTRLLIAAVMAWRSSGATFTMSALLLRTIDDTEYAECQHSCLRFNLLRVTLSQCVNPSGPDFHRIGSSVG